MPPLLTGMVLRQQTAALGLSAESEYGGTDVLAAVSGVNRAMPLAREGGEDRQWGGVGGANGQVEEVHHGRPQHRMGDAIAGDRIRRDDAVGPGPTSTEATFAPLEELLLEELLLEDVPLEELLLEELVPDELPVPLAAFSLPLPPQALRTTAASRGNTTRLRLGIMRISCYWSSATSTPAGTRLGT